MTKIFDKEFFKQVLLIWIGVNISKNTFNKEDSLKVGFRSNMKPREIEKNVIKNLHVKCSLRPQHIKRKIFKYLT